MSAPTTAWDETSPAGTADIKEGDDRIRELKIQLREIITVDHKMDSSGTGATFGYHENIHLIETADIGAGASGICLLGAQTSGYTAGKPELYFTDEDNDDVQITRDGVLAILPGFITIWGGAIGSLPTGYLVCDGTAKSRTTYADLFAAIGITHGSGDGSTTFNLPALGDAFVVGVKSGGTLAVAASGGNISFLSVGHTHTVASHTHTGASHNHDVVGSTGQNTFTNGASSSGSSFADDTHYHTISFTSGNSGTGATSGTALTSDVQSVLPPYYALCYIIKI